MSRKPYPRDAVERAKKTKTERHLESMSIDHVPNVIVKEFVVPSHRKTIRLANFHEYLSVLRERGWTIEDFSKHGYSKHQIGFFNFVMKGKLKITADEFRRDYCDKFISLEDVATKYGLPKGYMTFIREHFGIKRIGSKGLARGRSETPLTTRQKEIIYGTLMGDASRLGERAIKVWHSIDQVEYCQFIFNELKELCSNDKLKVAKSYDDRYDRLLVESGFNTRNHHEIKMILDDFYHDGKKVITKRILDRLTDLSLAVWFMDDGSSLLSRGGGKIYGICEVRIYTCSFSASEIEIISNWFFDKHGIRPIVRYKEANNRLPVLCFNKKEADIFRGIVDGFIVESMRYKIEEKELVKKRFGSKVSTDVDMRKMPTKSKFVSLSDDRKTSIVNAVFDYCRNYGFPYIKMDKESLELSFKRICNWKKTHLFRTRRTIKMNTNSTNIIWHFQPHMFNMATKRSLTPVDIFNSDFMLKDAIRRRLQYGGTCTPSGMRSALKEYKNNRAVSNFLPSVAKAVYLLFGKNLRVLDFCGGFGGRLLGAMGAKTVSRYVYIDPLEENCNGIKQMVDAFSNLYECSVRIVNGMAEDEIDGLDEEFDLVFTSPPYFGLEKYSGDDTQCYNKYSDYHSWIEHWLVPVVVSAGAKLVDGGSIALSLGSGKKMDIVTDLLKCISDEYSLRRTICFEVPSISYVRGYKPKKKEKIIVLEKKK